MLLLEEFHNILLRVCFTMTIGMFNIYSEHHFILRIIAIIINFLMILLIENAFMRESLMLLVCEDLGLCKSKTSFEQLQQLRNWGIIDGHLLVQGESDYASMQLHYWRSFSCIMLHYQSIVILFQL